MEVVCLISPFPSSRRVIKSKLPSDPLTEDSTDLGADRALTPSALRASKGWRRGPWLPIAVAAIAAVMSVGMLNWLWQIKGRWALAASTGTFTPDPDPPIIPPPDKELLKPSSGELPGRLPLDKSIEMLLSAAPAIPVVERHVSANPRIAHWEIRFPSGNTVDTYARQLDALNIELGVIGGSDRIVYASGFTKDKPDRREGRADDEQRFYMTWRSGGTARSRQRPAFSGRYLDIGANRRPVLSADSRTNARRFGATVRRQARSGRGSPYGVRPRAGRQEL